MNRCDSYPSWRKDAGAGTVHPITVIRVLDIREGVAGVATGRPCLDLPGIKSLAE